MSSPAVIADSFVVARPRGCRVRTRLRPGEAEADALRDIGTQLGLLRLTDLTDRLNLGRVGGDAERARRKKALTPQCSSRWAGSITRANNDQYALAMRALAANIDSLEQAISTISKRLAVPVATVEGSGKKRVRGYANAGQWFVKSRRLGLLASVLTLPESSSAMAGPAWLSAGTACGATGTTSQKPI